MSALWRSSICACAFFEGVFMIQARYNADGTRGLLK